MLDVIELTSELVRVPSVNPMGRRDVAGAGEKQVAERLADALRKIGAEVEISYPLHDRPNLIGRIRPDARRAVLFEAHMDTVPVETMTIDPFGGEVRDGRVWGRGSADEKGPIAAMLCAVERAASELPDLGIIFAGTCDEEYQFKGVHALLRDLPGDERNRIQFAVIAEPTLLNPVVAHKGVVRWEASAFGKPAHSSTPQLGKNAIYMMARFIQEMEALAERLSEAPPHPRLGPPSLSVGTIRGGTAVNVVPDLCTIEIDRRLVPGESADAAGRQVEEIAARHEIHLSQPIVSAPAFEVDEQSEPVRACLSAARNLHREAKPLYVNYCTNGTFYPQAEIPAVVFGPGSIEQAHTANEWIAVDELRDGVEAYYSILQYAAAEQL